MNRILIIEDNLEIRENTTEMLQLRGFHVFIAENGEDGISKAIAHLPDLILCDIQMPAKTGYEVLSDLRANEKTSMIPFVFFTASVEKREIQKAMDLGANGYLCKPFEPDQLFDIIQDVLRPIVEGEDK